MLPVNELRNIIQEKSPLIHNITNVVVTNFTANGLYALGASPVMAYAEEEVADMASVSQALVINIGTLTKPVVNAMLLAGKAANKAGVPIILDPVGAGATPYRTETAQRLLTELDITLIRGNASEIANLSDENVKMKGVDSTAEVTDAAEIAKNVALKWKTVTALTGKTDVITDGHTTYTVENGHALQSKITGAGCLLSAVTGAFIAVHDNVVEAATAAIGFYGVAAEHAATRRDNMGPGHFQMHFLDALYDLKPEDIEQLISIHS
ncbi:hydroxyethylthiazole kinase [Salipaludibacillus agaradhaerens]|jgi:hydroxyethylthiazole kinase|uniref:hydroxyethylthiazole kinase n=1 Tax=Salipaludibacillus agaradhaerens TaxID=76935 RepID=UPI002150A724|nr:hydroxyethylthiazole kinase [Salipaludibacillus agaradhaerens]MCR6105782.1 hydroxyethylthiazole kinase [Salipaludibacillus agaradhaerens]MCR6117818.1 hydroxyethylthiazole kinase [Salipaludibacillus agaradhaerens]